MLRFSSSRESQQSRFSAYSDRKTSHLIAYGGFNVFAQAVLLSRWRQTVCNNFTPHHEDWLLTNLKQWMAKWLILNLWLHSANRSVWVISVTTRDKYTERHIKYYLLTSGLVCTSLSVWAPDFKSTSAYLSILVGCTIILKSHCVLNFFFFFLITTYFRWPWGWSSVLSPLLF